MKISNYSGLNDCEFCTPDCAIQSVNHAIPGRYVSHPTLPRACKRPFFEFGPDVSPEASFEMLNAVFGFSPGHGPLSCESAVTTPVPLTNASITNTAIANRSNCIELLTTLEGKTDWPTEGHQCQHDESLPFSVQVHASQ